MASPQSGIFLEGSPHHHFLEYALRAGESQARTRGVLAALLRDLRREDDTGTNSIVAFGPALWAQLAPGEAPDGLRPFQTIGRPDRPEVPGTQRDLLIWLHGPRVDDNMDRALAIHRLLSPIADLELDEKGFVYHDSRDLTGFVDGTANPRAEAARAAALVPDGRTGAGGAFVLSQRWVHDLEAFHALSVSDQERVIGRTKADSIELEGDAMPPDAHVARTDISVDGVPQEIYRRSVPYGSVAEHGLYFLAFTCDPARFDNLLRSMFGLSKDAIRDRLTAYSRPVTSSYWFAPSEEAMRAHLEAR